MVKLLHRRLSLLTTSRQRSRILKQPQCPYVGLSPFREEDSDSFFGRDLLTKEIVQRLQKERLIVLVGPSGSGKTSVLQAGILPTLKDGEGLKAESGHTSLR